MATTSGMSWFKNPIGFEDNIQITDPATEVALGTHSTVVGQEISIGGVFTSSIVLATRSQAGSPFGCAFATVLGQDLTIPQVFYSVVLGSGITTHVGLTNSVLVSCLSGNVGVGNFDLVGIGSVLALGDDSPTSVLIGTRLDVDQSSPNSVVIGDNDVGGGKMVGLQSPRNVVIGHFDTGSISDYCSDNIAIGTKSKIATECTNNLAVLGATIGDHSNYCLVSGASSALTSRSASTAVYGPYNTCGQSYGNTIAGNNLRTGDGVVNTIVIGVGTGGHVQVDNSSESIVAIGVLAPGAISSSVLDFVNIGNGNLVGSASVVGLVMGYQNEVKLNNRKVIAVGQNNDLEMNGYLNQVYGSQNLLDSGASTCVLLGYYLSVGSSARGCIAIGSSDPVSTGSSIGSSCLHGILIGNACAIGASITNGLVIGHGATVNATDGIAIGASSIVNNFQSICVGTSASSSGANGIALGAFATCAANVCSIGCSAGPSSIPTDMSIHTFAVRGWDLTAGGGTGAAIDTIKAVDNPASGSTGLTVVYYDGLAYANKTIKAASSLPIGAMYLYIE